MRTMLLLFMMMFAALPTVHAQSTGSREEAEAAKEGDLGTAAKSVEQEGCFNCRNQVRRVGPTDPQVEAQNRATDVYGKAQPTTEGDSSAVKEKGN